MPDWNRRPGQGKRYVISRDLLRRTLGLTPKEFEFVTMLERETTDASLAYVGWRRDRFRLGGRIKPTPKRAALRLYKRSELKSRLGGSPSTATRILRRLVDKRILLFVDARPGSPIHSLGPEHGFYIPKGARRLYRYIGPVSQPDSARQPPIMAQYLALRLLEAGNAGALQIVPDPSEGRLHAPDIFIVPGLETEVRLDLSRDAEQAAFRRIAASAGALLEAYAERTFRRPGKSSGDTLLPTDSHWWWQLRAPMIIIDLSWPPYRTASSRSGYLVRRFAGVTAAADRYFAKQAEALRTNLQDPNATRT